jgi:hypothetical protein
MEAIKNYADQNEIRTHAGKANWIRQSNALTTRPPCHIWYWRQLNICRIKKMEAIKNYADKDEIRTHAGKAHWISLNHSATLSYLILETVEYM